VIVETDDEAVAGAVDRLEALLADRVNARSVTATDRFDELVERARPQMAAIGPAFGADAQAVMTAVEGATREGVESGLVVDGETVELDDEMVTYVAEPPESVTGVDFDGGTVYVDTSLTPAIESEGYARDVIRRVQEMRKELDLDVEAAIRLGVDADDETVASAVNDHADLVAGEVRAAAWLDDADAADGLVETWTIEGETVTIGIELAE
jgi:isoleucyl-tRNA synthetase